jgi:DNA-nicking Smr family endonuclease
MADFGRIFEQWESMRGAPNRRTGKKQPRETAPEPDEAAAMRAWMDEQLDRYPVVDKDAGSGGDDSPGDGGVHPERLPIDDTIDLHGFTLAEALVETERFVEESLASGYRKVLVIHGKGRDGEGVLKREIRAYLERHRYTGAMDYARGPDGGRGALWVVLRKRGG